MDAANGRGAVSGCWSLAWGQDRGALVWVTDEGVAAKGPPLGFEEHGK